MTPADYWHVMFGDRTPEQVFADLGEGNPHRLRLAEWVETCEQGAILLGHTELRDADWTCRADAIVALVNARTEARAG